MKSDITFGERKLLSCIRHIPGIFIGKANLTYLEHFIHGYNTAMYFTGVKDNHNILPDGFNSFIALKYNLSEYCPKNAFTLIIENTSDEENAFDLFFNLLDEYLVSLKFKPIPLWNVKKDSINQLKTILASDNHKNSE